MWRRHCGTPPPSHHVLRATCVQLLPLVEMYCKWELEEDCTNLRSLMQRFDSEEDLKTHELGRSLLCMIRNDDIEVDTFPVQLPFVTRPNPFDAVRERLAEAATAIHDLHARVHPHPMPTHANDITNIVCFKFQHGIHHVEEGRSTIWLHILFFTHTNWLHIH